MKKITIMASLGMFVFVACDQLPENKSDVQNDSTLKNALTERKSAARKKFSQEKLDLYADGIRSVAESGIYDRALKVGAKAPNFTLKNHDGNAISLYDELKKGAVILTWYRGGWCPYCNINLRFLQDKLSEFKAAGATLMALTPELPDNSLKTAEKNKLEFTVLSDLGNKVAKEYGLVFKLTPEVAAIYEKAFGMRAKNGDNSDELPLAATYVIDKDGIIKFAFVDADYTKRAEPSDIIKTLKNK